MASRWPYCLEGYGANVYVTSGHDEKINKALELGAKGGVNYRQKNWPVQLEALLRKHHGKGDGALLSAVIDSGGGDIVESVGKVLKRGGRVVIYGMTANPQVTFTMREVLKNQKILGSTMGSHKDLIEATAFISKHKIVPVVSSVLDGLESAEEGFKIIEGGSQFGKVVIRIRHNESVKESRAKL
ncbi:Zinc-type Alcohol Dehydrogenase-like protein [Abortiporus biennis]